ncbi:MAG TPA: hypothetical protein VGL65_13385 [Gemmatimonadales bacterium]|jgi:hypothetical protein
MMGLIVCFAYTLLPARSLAAQAGPRIILIRHGEKPADAQNPHLSPAGVRRAQTLVTFVTHDPAIAGPGLPVAIFATRTTHDGDGQRTQETVTPLARTLHLAVQAPFHGSEYARLARAILSDRALAGKTILICWNHEEIPQLAAALGVRPEPRKWKDGNFDQVDIITYHKGRARLAITRYGAP